MPQNVSGHLAWTDLISYLFLPNLQQTWKARGELPRQEQKKACHAPFSDKPPMQCSESDLWNCSCGVIADTKANQFIRYGLLQLASKVGGVVIARS